MQIQRHDRARTGSNVSTACAITAGGRSPFAHAASSLVVLGLLAFALPGCGRVGDTAAALGSQANVTALSHNMVADAFLVRGELDWGYQVLTTIRNNGDRGDVTIRVTLTSSEGQWERNQQLHMESGETMDLAYLFTEPSVNATNIQYRLFIWP